MKTIIAITVLAFTVSIGHAQQLETYNAGVLYSDILETNFEFMFDQSSGNGIGGGGAIIPASDAMAVNFLRRGPFDFTVPNCTFQISTMFQIKAPSLTGLGGGLQIGFMQSESGEYFISPGQNNDMSLWVYPTSTTLTGGGYAFEQEVYFNLYNGSSSSGSGYGTSSKPILKTGEWYKMTLSITRDSSTTLDLFSTVDDYGTTGSNFVSRLDAVFFSGATGPSGFPFTSLTSISNFIPAIAAGFDYGIKTVDNTAISAPMTASENVAEKTDFELDFPTIAGHQYFIQSSPDLIQWKVIETAIGNGSTFTRYYPITSSSQFYRVVPN